ncbi:hypothetical protein [Labrys wisconsinensis]|uniref:N-formylglutamate amidohydrolase n=1 Tax=Labrys wisconsinensis TaxID=425677 RepID=A0ABU0J8W4_9HYPH|nr:hypothetical protein [Labrys wisconsinensis]MDQ0470704.1 N-formylglutamate amidohydrolase [Labrys wisconsinensis]
MARPEEASDEHLGREARRIAAAARRLAGSRPDLAEADRRRLASLLDDLAALRRELDRRAAEVGRELAGVSHSLRACASYRRTARLT